MEGVKIWLSSQVADFFDTGIQKLTPDTSVSIPVVTTLRCSRYSDWVRAGRLKGRSSNPYMVKNFSSPRRPGWFWDPPNLLSNGYRGLLLRGKLARTRS
jgi:hypothetical protein